MEVNIVKWNNLEESSKKDIGKRILQERTFAHTKHDFGRFLSSRYGTLDQASKHISLEFGLPDLSDSQKKYMKIIVLDVDTFLDEIWEL